MSEDRLACARLSADETELVVADVDRGIVEARCRKPRGKRCGIDGHEGVVDVARSDEIEVEGVDADEDGAGP